MYIQVIIIIFGFLALNVWGSADNPRARSSHKKYIIFMMLLLTLQSGLRNLAVGPDTYNYYNKFVDISNANWNELFNKISAFYTSGEGKDPAYYFLLKFIQIFIPDFQLYLIALATFFFFALGRLFYRYTNNNYEVLLGVTLYQCLFYSFYSITGLRQTFATAFLFLAVPYVLERKFLKFLLLVLIASTQHKTALLFVPFYFLLLFKSPKKVILFAFIMCAQMSYFVKSLTANLLAGTFFDQYTIYLEGYEMAGAHTFTLFILSLGLWILFASSKRNERFSLNTLFINSIAVSIAISPLLWIDPSNMRIVQYYSVFSIIILPVLTSVTFKNNTHLFYSLLIIILTIYTISRDLEYTFFWQEAELGENYR